MSNKPIIYVYDTVVAGGIDFDRVGMITDYSYLEFARAWNTTGYFKITIHIDTQGAQYLKENRIIYIDDERVGWIESVSITQRDNRANEFLTVEGTELKDQLHRWTLPPVGQDTDKYTSKSIETIIKSIIRKNAGDLAATERQIVGLITAIDQERGSVINFSTRHKQLLNEIVSLLSVDRMGLKCLYDPEAKFIVYDIAEGVDRTDKQSLNNPITLSTKWKTAKAYVHSMDISNYRNFAYCAGQGEGKDRVIITSYVGDSEPTGYARRELFIDARDIADNDELPSRAARKLSETILPVSIRVDYNNGGAYVFDEDFTLGDFVTAESARTSIDAQVIKAIYKYDSSVNREELSLILDFDNEDIERVITTRLNRYDSLLSKESGADNATGWVPVLDAWTYASANTITVPSGAASRFQRGDKLKLTQGGNVKYFYIVNVASTLLTVTGGTDYTVENAAISDIYISRAASPFGFPAYFNWMPTLYGSTTAGNPTYSGRAGKFTMRGGQTYIGLTVGITAKGGMTGNILIGGLPVSPTTREAVYFGYVYGFSAAGSKSIAGVIYTDSPPYIRMIYNQWSWLSDTDILDSFGIGTGNAFYY